MTFQEFATNLKLQITSESIPLRKDDAPHSFRYLVKLNWAGKVHPFEYWKGSAHVGFRIYDFGAKKFSDKWRMLTSKELKEWRYGNGFFFASPIRQPKPIPPQLAECLYSLQMDCSSFLDAPIWEDFADNLGLNSDSIKDKKIFDACSEATHSLRRFFEHQWSEFMKCTEE